MKQRILSVFLALVLLLSLLPAGAAAAEEGWKRIHVMETTDMHGHIAETLGRTDSEITWNLAAIAQDVEEARQNSTYADVLLLDGGDIYQGPPISNLLMGDPMKAAMDIMDYDAVALGNHEFDWDVTAYAADAEGTMPPYSFGTYEGDSDIPVLASNLYDAGTKNRVNFTKDYTTVTKAGCRVAIIGWIPDYSGSIMASKIRPYDIDSNIGRFKDRVREINAKENPDITVVVTHNSPAGLAKAMDSSQVQLVCGGHSHKMTAGTARNGVAYMQGGASAKGYAEADILVNRATGEVKVENLKKTYLSGDLRDTGSNPNLDPEILAVSKAAWEEVRGSVEEVLGTADRVPQDLGNFITSLMLDATADLDTKIAVTNAGGIRDEFHSREITAGDIYAICPFGNRILTYDFTGRELESVLRDRNLTSGAHMAGGDVIFDDGTRAEPNETYRVCVNEFCATRRNSLYENRTPVQPMEKAPVDNESMVESLRRIGNANGGRIPLDSEDHVVPGNTPEVTVTYEKVPAKEPTCTEEGNILYWKGSDGKNYILDEEGHGTETADTVLPKVALDFAEKVPATYVSTGTEAHWVCPKCGKLFSDGQGKHPVTRKDLEIPMTDLPFEDVSGEAWYVPDIRYVLSEGLMNGHTHTEFEPEGSLTRAQMTQILYNREGSPEFTAAGSFGDVHEADWFWNPVMWAAASSYVGGYDNGCFGPDDYITREQLAAILYRCSGQPDTDGTLDCFTDRDQVSSYALVPLQWAVEKGIMGGKGGGILDPKGNATRAEAAKMIRCYIENAEMK